MNHPRFLAGRLSQRPVNPVSDPWSPHYTEADGEHPALRHVPPGGSEPFLRVDVVLESE